MQCPPIPKSARDVAILRLLDSTTKQEHRLSDLHEVHPESSFNQHSSKVTSLLLLNNSLELFLSNRGATSKSLK
jgi:hypothetical protein